MYLGGPLDFRKVPDVTTLVMQHVTDGIDWAGSERKYLLQREGYTSPSNLSGDGTLDYEEASFSNTNSAKLIDYKFFYMPLAPIVFFVDGIIRCIARFGLKVDDGSGYAHFDKVDFELIKMDSNGNEESLGSGTANCSFATNTTSDYVDIDAQGYIVLNENKKIDPDHRLIVQVSPWTHADSGRTGFLQFYIARGSCDSYINAHLGR